MTSSILTTDLLGEESPSHRRNRKSDQTLTPSSFKIKSTKLRANHCITFLCGASLIIFIADLLTSSKNYINNNSLNQHLTFNHQPHHHHSTSSTADSSSSSNHLDEIYLGPILFASGHVVLTRDDQGQSLVLTGEDGKKDDGGDQLVIAGHNYGGGGQDSKMIMQDASNRDGDVVINGRSMIIPGEDGHIVLADNRRDDSGPQHHQQRHQYPPPNPFMYWAPYMSSRMMYRMMPFFG